MSEYTEQDAVRWVLGKHVDLMKYGRCDAEPTHVNLEGRAKCRQPDAPDHRHLFEDVEIGAMYEGFGNEGLRMRGLIDDAGQLTDAGKQALEATA